MAKRLTEAGLFQHMPFDLVTLTRRGRLSTLEVRRHRLIETFLHRVLAFDVDEVHEEVEELERAVSARFVERIAVMLGNPSHDPHGDPTPSLDGTHEERDGEHVPLAEVPPGTHVRVERVPDRDRAALRWLAELELLPGTYAGVRRQDPFGGPLWVAVAAGREEALSSELAALVMVSGMPEGSSGG